MKLTNIKRKLRSDSAGYRAAVIKTGGGPPPSPIQFRSEPEAALYTHIALSVDGLPTIGDSDDVDVDCYNLEEIDDMVLTDVDENNDDEKDDGKDEKESEEKDDEKEDEMETEKEDGKEGEEEEGENEEEKENKDDDLNSQFSVASTSGWNKYNPKMLKQAKSRALQTGMRNSNVSRNLSSSIIALREIEIKQKLKFENEKHKKAMLLEDGKLREQELRIKLLEAELRARNVELDK